MKKRSYIHIIRWLLLLGIISLSLGVARLLTTQTGHTSDTKENSVNLAYTLATKPPAIDAAAPSVFETASFGLG